MSKEMSSFHGRKTSSSPLAMITDFNVKDAFSIFARQWWIVVAFTLIGIALAFYQFTITKPLYQSSSVMYVASSSAIEEMSGGSANSGMRSRFRGETLTSNIAVMKSVKLLSTVWESILADESKKSQIKSIPFETDPIKASRIISDCLEVESSWNGSKNILSAKYKTGDPNEAAVVLNEVLVKFQDYFNKSYTDSTKVVMETINKARSDMALSIEAADKELKDYIQNSNVVFIGDENSNPLLSRIAELETKLVDLEFQILSYTNRQENILDRISGRNIDELGEREVITILSSGDNDTILTSVMALSNPNAAEIQERSSRVSMIADYDTRKVGDLLLQQAQLEQKFGPDYPEIAAIKKQIEALQSVKEKVGENLDISEMKFGLFSFQELLKMYLEVSKARIENLKKQQVQIREYLRSQDDDIREISKYRQTIDSKRVAIESQKELYNQLGYKLENLALQGNFTGYQTEILESAIPNPNPVSPVFILYMLVGLGGGLATGFILAFLVDISDATFRTPEEIIEQLRIPILAQFPSFITNKIKGGLSKKTKKPIPGIVSPALITFHSPESPLCEVFNTLRTKLFFSSHQQSFKILQLTSPHPSDGKTLLTCNLAVKLAQSKKRVLLIDGDLRKPDIHKWFGMKNEIGFSDVLAGVADTTQVVQNTPQENLFLITAGHSRKNPSELLTLPTMDDFLEEIQNDYDIILIDSPPSLYVSDTTLLASKVKNVLYVFRIRKRGRPDVMQGMNLLKEVGANIIGCVINCLNKHHYYNEFAMAKNSTYGYGYGSNYGYGYGSKYGYGYGHRYGYGYGYGYGDSGNDEDDSYNKTKPKSDNTRKTG